MAIKPIVNEPLRVVALSCEPELLQRTSYDDLQKYQMNRDLDALPIKDLEEAPTIFTILPLLPDYEYMLGAVRSGSYNMIRELVRLHITDVENFDEAEFEEKKGRKAMTSKSIQKLPLEAIEELAKVIEEGTTRGSTIPFSLQDSIMEAKKQVELRSIFA